MASVIAWFGTPDILQTLPGDSVQNHRPKIGGGRETAVTFGVCRNGRIQRNSNPNAMKRYILTLILAVTAPAATAQNAHDLLQEAAYQERALGNLERANEIYTLILESHATADRELSARSLYQLAVNHETLGHGILARQAFQRLVSEFPEQRGLVSEALARGVPTPSAGDVTKRVVWDMNDTTGLTDGEPSPDGRFVSFAAWETGDLGIKSLETGEITLLTDEGTWDVPSRFADNSAWSRDGSQIAFAWWDGGDAYLKVVDIATGTVRTVVQEYVLPWAWTSDGRILGMWGDRDGTRLAFVSAVHGSMEVLYEPPSRRGLRADLSPDEQWVLFSTIPAEDVDEREVYIVSAAGGQPKAVAAHPADDRFAYWHPDGRSFVFESDRSGSDALWRVRVASGQQVGEPELVYGDMRHALTRGFSSDGRLFVERSQSESTGNLYTLGFDAESAAATSAPVRMPLLGMGYNAGASFSSDGRYMSYVSQRPNSVLVVRDLTTGREVEHDLEATRLLRHRVDKPVWRPGTRQLLVATQSGPRIVDAISGDIIASIDMVDLEMKRPTWSAEGEVIWGLIGNMIGYVPVPEGETLRLLDGKAPEVTAWRILPEDEYCEGPAVHPTDGTVAYWCDYRVMYRLDPATGEATEWWRVPEGEPTIAHNIHGSFVYTPDGSNLMFQRWREGEGDPQTQVWRLPVGASAPVPVSGTIPVGWGLEVHPSGEQAIYTVLDGARNEMWVLEGLDGK